MEVIPPPPPPEEPEPPKRSKLALKIAPPGGGIAPPSQPPPTPRTDLRSRGFDDASVEQYRNIFNALDKDRDGFLTVQDIMGACENASRDDASWMLTQFLPSHVYGQVQKVDLSTFARVCEEKKNTEWNATPTFAFEEISRILSQASSENARAETLMSALRENAGVVVTVEEAAVMLEALSSKEAFLKALGVSTPATQQHRLAPSAVPVASNQSGESNQRPASPFAQVLASIGKRRDSAEDGGKQSATVGKQQSSNQGLIFFDGSGDPSILPRAGPSLAETKYPPPTPPPLPN